MIDSDYRAWDECPNVDSCELIHSFLELVDSMVRDIQHLKAETIRARYELSQKYDPGHEWITTVDILSDLDLPHYDSLAYQEYVMAYYDGGDPMSFKDYIDSMVNLSKGIDDKKLVLCQEKVQLKNAFFHHLQLYIDRIMILVFMN